MPAKKVANQAASEDTSEAFKPTHIFTLEDGTDVEVAVSFRWDYVGTEADGTPWYTVMGPLELWWTCATRKVSKLKAVRAL